MDWTITSSLARRLIFSLYGRLLTSLGIVLVSLQGFYRYKLASSILIAQNDRRDWLVSIFLFVYRRILLAGSDGSNSKFL